MRKIEDWITISDINYCSDTISNLLSINKLIRKDYWYIDKEKKLEFYCPDNNIIFKKIFMSDDIYVLNLYNNRRPKPLSVLLKTNQVVNKKQAHHHISHIYYNRFSDLLKNANRLSISPKSPSTLFYKACIFDKQTKFYNKEPAMCTKDLDKR